MKPSEVVEQAVAALDDAFPDPLDVEGRIISRRVNTWTNSTGRILKFVNLELVDKDASGSTVKLAASMTFSDLQRMLSRSGLEPKEVTSEGSVVVVSGLLRGMAHTGTPQLQVTSIAPAGLSPDMLELRRVQRRIDKEGLADLRIAVGRQTRLVRRAVVIGSRTGFTDVRAGLATASHLPPPAACYHEINPHSTTVTIDVPRLIATHVEDGVDVVLLAFGGHLPVPSPWDTEPVIDAIVAAHRAGVAVLAGFAHDADQPLAKRVAFDLKQASAAARRLVQRNDERVAPLNELADALPTIAARHDDYLERTLRTGRRIASQIDQRHSQVAQAVEGFARSLVRRVEASRGRSLERVLLAAAAARRLDGRLGDQRSRLARAARSCSAAAAARRASESRRLATLARLTRDGLVRDLQQHTAIVDHRPRTAAATVSRAIEISVEDLLAVAGRVATQLAHRAERTATELRSTSLLSEMMDRGWAIVANSDGTPALRPAPGDRITVQTVASRYEAIVDHTDAGEPDE